MVVGFAVFVICIDQIVVALVELEPISAHVAKTWPATSKLFNVVFAAFDGVELGVVINSHCLLLCLRAGLRTADGYRTTHHRFGAELARTRRQSLAPRSPTA